VGSVEKDREVGLQVVIGLLSGVEGAHFFSARLPSKMTIRKFAESEEDRQNIVSAIWESALLSLSLGGLVSLIGLVTKTPYWWIPVTINAGITAGLSLMYWNDLRAAMEKQPTYRLMLVPQVR
jgi:hypothetical protein